MSESWRDVWAGALRCAACAMVFGPEAVRCATCGRSLVGGDGLLDLTTSTARVGGAEGGGVLRRRFHRRVVRPLVRAVSGVDDAADAAFLRRHVAPVGPRVLEVGCGYGREARVLASLFRDASVLAVDLSGAALRNARAASVGHGVAFARADAMALPVVDGAVGAVNTFGVLHLVPDPARLVAEAARVLAPGGTFTGQTVVAPWPGVPRTTTRAALLAAAAAAGLEPVAEAGARGVLLFAFRRPR